MKPNVTRRGFLLAVLVGASLLPSLSHAAVIVVGSGADVSYLVLESPGLGTRTYEVHYTYGAGPYNAKFLLDQAIAGDNTLTVTLSQYGTTGTPPVPNYFVDAINGEGIPYAAPNYWVQWVSGGSGYQNGDYSFNPGSAPTGTWTIGYGISTHTIAPGSWDALVYSDGSTPPSVSPVPETSSALLGVVGGLVLLRRRRHDS